MAFTVFKQGAAAQALVQQDHAEAEARKAEMGKMFRFYMKEAEPNVQVTFVDGDLHKDGYLDPPRFYEHNIGKKHGKGFDSYVCPEKTDPQSGQKCPICEDGDRPSLVALFTVIDHRVVQSTKTPGKSYQDRPKILAAKPQTFEVLNKLALTHGGLVGVTFEVWRIGDKSAAVGSHFNFVAKNDPALLTQAFTEEFEDQKTKQKGVRSVFVPANYGEEIIGRDEMELRKLGFGKTPMMSMSPGGVMSPGGPTIALPGNFVKPGQGKPAGVVSNAPAMAAPQQFNPVQVAAQPQPVAEAAQSGGYEQHL